MTAEQQSAEKAAQVPECPACGADGRFCCLYADAAPVTEWGHRYPDGSIIADSSEVVAKSRAAISRGPGGRPLTLMRRTVTDWTETDRG